MISHQNIRGLNNKITELKLYLKTNSPDIMTLNESGKIKPNTKIPGYIISQPKEHIGQGVSILYKQHLNIDEVDPIITTIDSKSTNIQHSILLHTPTNTIQISTIYCPRGEVSVELLEGLILRHKDTIITGDFNSRHEDFGHDRASQSGTRLVNTMTRHKYTKLNDNEPTFTSDISFKQDVKDLMFSSKELTKLFDEFWVDEDLGSDHNIISSIFTHKLTNPRTKTIYLYHKANWESINNIITNEMQTTKINTQSSCQELDQYITHLTDTINNTIDSNVKTLKISPKSIGLPKETIQMIHEKRKLRKLYHRTGIKLYKHQYNTLNKQIKHKVRIEHQKRWEKGCDDLELDPLQDQTWTSIKQMMGLKPKKVTIPTLITKKDNKIIRATTTTKKLEIMTETMKNIFTHDDPKPYFNNEYKNQVENELETLYSEKLKPTSIPQNINIYNTEHTITKEEIKHEINKSKSKSASGGDKISNKIIKYLEPSLLNILHKYFNITLHKGYHTINWKLISAILLNKPGKEKSDPVNYRTISLIQNLSKLIERILTKRITSWAENKNKINKEQSGFRAKRSALDNIFELTQIAMDSKNNNKYSAAIFMDIEKAFDKIWHDGLIYTLIDMEMPAIYVRYIKSFISNRYFYFHINGIRSPNIFLKNGIPQGSSLSAILFIMYVAGIPKPNNPETFLTQYADDIKIFAKSTKYDDMQQKLQVMLNEIIDFCGKQRISISFTKTYELVFIKRNHNYQMRQVVYLGNLAVKGEQTGKFLGVHFDKRLNFTEHIKQKQTTSRGRAIQLQRLHSQKFGPSNKTMIRLFKTLVRPIIDYGHVALITAKPRSMTKLEVIQTKFLRNILRTPRINNKTLLKMANLPTLTDRIKHRAHTWFHNTITHNNEINNFIKTQIKITSNHITPYSIINNLC